MARPIVTGHAGTVQHERHARVVEGAIHQDLIESAIEERGIHRHHGVQSAVGQAGGTRSRMLLRDPDVVGSIRVARCESLQAGGPQHRSGDRNDVGLVASDLEHLVSEDRCPRRSGLRQGLTGVRINHPDAVKTIRFVVFGRGVATPLGRDRVDDHRLVEIACSPQSEFKLLLVVAVDGADVLQPKILEKPLRRHHILNAFLHSVQSVIERATYEGSALKETLPPRHEPFVVARGAQCCEMVREAADRRRI